LQRLKSETRPHHEAAERTVRLMEPELTREGYRWHLEALYGLFAPLEAALASEHLGLPAELRAPERWKLPLLVKDLQAQGHDAASLERLPRATRLPALTGLPEALGCFYVLEGSTLGGQLLLRHLRRHFKGVSVGDFHFFRAYGEEVGPMWRVFGEVLSQASAAAASEDFDARVVQAAKDTFDAFEVWLSRERVDGAVRI
jgi:heme oxygenase